MRARQKVPSVSRLLRRVNAHVAHVRMALSKAIIVVKIPMMRLMRVSMASPLVTRAAEDELLEATMEI